VFSAALTDALGACYWKPVQSGLEEETDSETVLRLGKIPSQRILPEAWRLTTPVSPHLSAEIDARRLLPTSSSGRMNRF
jgi:dethiobiotin synthetase